jgi:hypothetical protein
MTDESCGPSLGSDFANFVGTHGWSSSSIRRGMRSCLKLNLIDTTTIGSIEFIGTVPALRLDRSEHVGDCCCCCCCTWTRRKPLVKPPISSVVISTNSQVEGVASHDESKFSMWNSSCLQKRKPAHGSFGQGWQGFIHFEIHLRVSSKPKARIKGKSIMIGKRGGIRGSI